MNYPLFLKKHSFHRKKEKRSADEIYIKTLSIVHKEEEMAAPIDTNIENYTIPELLTILNIEEDPPTTNEIRSTSNYYIQKFTKEGNVDMTHFFSDLQNTLLQYVEELNQSNASDPSAKQTDEWYQNEVLKQDDPTQSSKNTDRKQKIDVYNNPHVPMNQEHLGVNNTYSVPVAQDVLNPTLKNTIQRTIVLDSQYRQSSAPNETSTDYTLDLSEPLINVLNLRLYSYSIPYTWYTIDTAYNNTCFWLIIPNKDPVTISVLPGNYTPESIVVALNSSFLVAGFHGNPIVSYNTTNGKLTIQLYGQAYEDIFINEETIITFFNPGAELSCNNTACVQTLAINQTLGWLLGFRIPVTNVSASGNTGLAIVDLYGPKYFIIVLDDLNQNHINSGLIGITELSKVVKMPSYYSPDLPYTCIPANPYKTNLLANSNALAQDEDAGILIVDKLNATYAATPQVLPSAPRILTQSQIYSINEIMKNNGRTYNYKLKSPVVSDTFSILPIKIGNSPMGTVISEFSGSLQDNKRVYFGPVNISRMRLKLLDDRGNVVNLNGCDWCITLMSENLYQY